MFNTQRLCIRKPTLEDAEQLYLAYTSKLEIPRFMSWVAHTHIKQTEGFLEHCISDWKKQSNFEYVIAEEIWNRGITSEVLHKLVDWSLSQRSVFRTQAHCDAENTASAKVMEKAGMSYEGLLRKYLVHPNTSDEPRDSLMYAKVRWPSVIGMKMTFFTKFENKYF